MAVAGDRIAAVGELPEGVVGPDTKVIDAAGKYLAPGFIDAHIHIESSMLTYTEFAKMVVKHGTTAVASDLMEITIVSGVEGMKEVLDESEHTPVKLYYPVPAFKMCIRDRARALVMEPALLLLDEPLSNLDAKLRVEMQVEIKRIQRELGVTTIIVTHDHEEAVSLADRVVVMNAGHIMQIGTPDGVFDYPENPYVADFMGFTNLFDGTVAAVDGETVTVTDANGNQFRAHDRFHTGFAAGDAVQLAIRPDNILPADGPGENVVTGTIQNVTYKGVVSRIDVEGVLKDALLHINIHNYDSGKAGARMDAKLPADKLLIYKN